MAHKSSKLATIAFLVLTLVSPMFAQRTPASDQQWSWFGNCGEKKFMGIQIALSGKVIYRSSFPICPIGDRSREIHKSVLFSMKGGHVFQASITPLLPRPLRATFGRLALIPALFCSGFLFVPINKCC